MFNFSGKVALVAGGAGYFGSSICRGLSEQGASVMVADINRERIDAVVKQTSNEFPSTRIEGLDLDIADEASIRSVVRQTVERFGRLDILINSTYSSIGKKVEDLTAAELDSTLHLNVTGAFLLAREAVSVMRDGGSMVFFSSMYGHIAPDPRIYDPPLNPNPIEYGVAKAGIEQMTRYLAVHWANKNIRVNAVAPGAFPHAHQQRDYPVFMQKLAQKSPAGRIGRQDELTGAVVFLASDEASFITGQVLDVDGGVTIW